MLDSPVGFSRREAVRFSAILVLLMLGGGVILGFLIGIPLGIARATHSSVPAWLSPSNPSFTLAANLAAFGFGIDYALRRTKASWQQLLVGWSLSPLALVAVLVALVGLAMVHSELHNTVQWLAPTPAWIRSIFAPMADLSSHPISGPVLLVVVAPVTEELFFRGLLLRRLLAVVPARSAIWTSALLFMAFHLNPWQFPIALLTGLIFGWVYARTSSLGLCVAGHAFVNAGALLNSGLPFQIRGFNLPHGTAPVAFQPWWFDVAGLVVLLAGLFLVAHVTPGIRRRAAPVEPPVLVA